MLIIVKFFWKICLFRQGPENIPKSVPITVAVLLFYVSIALLTTKLVNPHQSFYHSFMTVGISGVIEAAFIFSLLGFKSVRQRFLSTYCAFLGANTIFLILMLPVDLLVLEFDTGIVSNIVQTVWILSFFWWLNIVGFIFHKAANISQLQGTILAFIVESLAIMAVLQYQQPNLGT